MGSRKSRQNGSGMGFDRSSPFYLSRTCLLAELLSGFLSFYSAMFPSLTPLQTAHYSAASVATSALAEQQSRFWHLMGDTMFAHFVCVCQDTCCYLQHGPYHASCALPVQALSVSDRVFILSAAVKVPPPQRSHRLRSSAIVTNQIVVHQQWALCHAAVQKWPCLHLIIVLSHSAGSMCATVPLSCVIYFSLNLHWTRHSPGSHSALLLPFARCPCPVID